MNKEKKVILYSRVSTTDQKDHGYSLADQEARLEKYCELNNYTIVFTVREDASGKTFDRPQFKNVMEFIKRNKGAANMLLFVKWDRFSRNATDALNMIRTLLASGILVNAIEQPIDVTVPEQKLMLSFYVTTPEVENDRRSMNVISGMRRANVEGRYLGSAPKGYKNARDHSDKPILLPDENAPLIKEAFQLAATGLYSQQELLREMNKGGLKCAKSQFSILLQNRVYAGKVFVKATYNEEARWVDGIHEAFVSTEIFDTVQEILSGRRAKSKRVKIQQLDANLPLRGLLLCSHCGNKLTGSASRGNGGRYYYYHCHICKKDRFRADVVNSQLEEMLDEIRIEPVVKDLYQEIIKDMLKDTKDTSKSEIQRREKEIAKQQERINKITDLLADGEMSKSDYVEAKKRYESEIQKLTSEKNKFRMNENEFAEYLKWGLSMMENIKAHYELADVGVKQKIIGSMYPENLTFSKGRLRTIRVNELLVSIQATRAAFEHKKTEQHHDNLMLSGSVPRTGIEPVRHYYHRFLRPTRLPIPPPGHTLVLRK